MSHQMDLPIKPDMLDVDVKAIDAQSCMSKAIALCQTLGGIEDKELCGTSGIVRDIAQWSRIKSGQHYFPQDKLGYLMDLCRNEVPLYWLARQRGYNLVPMETETQRQLRLANEALEEERLKNRVLLEALQGRR